MSAIYGRNVIYHASFNLFSVFTFPVAFAPRTCMYVSYVTSCTQFALDLLGRLDTRRQLFSWAFGSCAGIVAPAFLSDWESVSDMFSDSAKSGRAVCKPDS